MNKTEAIAAVFMTALRAMPKTERAAVLARIANEPDMREDLLDLTVVAARRGEPSRPLREYLAGKRK